MSVDKNIDDVLRLQDVELANAMGDLSSNPAKLNDFITKRKADVYNTVSKEHSDNFQKVYGDMTRASDGTSNIMYYHTRNKDLDTLQGEVFSRAKAEAEAVQYDSQIAKRQAELNDWTANNKMDTLFFLQLVFITLTITAPLLYVHKIGLLPSSAFYGISSLLGVALALTFLVRMQYTWRTRDLRYWNRRRFAKAGGEFTPPTCESIKALEGEFTKQYQSVQSQFNDGLKSTQTRVEKAWGALSQ